MLKIYSMRQNCCGKKNPGNKSKLQSEILNLLPV